MAKKVRELTADEARSIAGNVCDTMNATLTDIYTKIEEQAKMGRKGMKYEAHLAGLLYENIKEVLKKKGYSVSRNGMQDMIYSFNIFWTGIPF
ncbi:MAG: hypothetical protein Q8K92_08400 [Leadbetterella sp.]|nr:hypothetical protein [Leadbetterella sp.]